MNKIQGKIRSTWLNIIYLHVHLPSIFSRIIIWKMYLWLIQLYVLTKPIQDPTSLNKFIYVKIPNWLLTYYIVVQRLPDSWKNAFNYPFLLRLIIRGFLNIILGGGAMPPPFIYPWTTKEKGMYIMHYFLWDTLRLYCSNERFWRLKLKSKETTYAIVRIMFVQAFCI